MCKVLWIFNIVMYERLISIKKKKKTQKQGGDTKGSSGVTQILTRHPNGSLRLVVVFLGGTKNWVFSQTVEMTQKNKF